MIPPLDPFALNFDSIEVDSARAPTAAAIAHAMSLAGPQEDMLVPSAAAPDLPSPGFYLTTNAGGRFTIDRDFGVVSLADDSLLETERNTVHPVRMRVVEPSGTTYELDIELRITGHVPQMVGPDEFAFFSEPSVTPTLAPVTRVAIVEPARTPWATFAASQGVAGAAPLGAESAVFGTLLATTVPAAAISEAALTLSETLPAPASAAAFWTV